MTAPRPQNRPRLITVAEAAAMLAVSKMTVYRRLKAGEIVSYRVAPNVIRVDADSVSRYLRQVRVVPDWAQS